MQRCASLLSHHPGLSAVYDFEDGLNEILDPAPVRTAD